MKTVTKRSGSIEPFDINKIRVVIDRACYKLDANPLQLEATVNTNIVDKTETKYLQSSLIEYALSFADIDNPDWLLVAGRLYMQQYRKDTIRSRGIDYSQSSFYNYLQYQVDSGFYDPDLLTVYSPEDIQKISIVLEPERDQDYNIGSATALVKKYMARHELPQEAFLAAAMTLHKKTGDVEAVKLSYERFSKRELSLATPSLIGLRLKDSSLSSCFILDMEDNLESIFNLITNIAKISKNNGGVGIHAGRIRAQGSYFQNTLGKSKGVLPFIKIINDTMVAIDQGKQICPSI